MGTIGNYHYDDDQCAIAVGATRILVDHLRDECRAQGPGFLDAYLGVVRELVIETLVDTGGEGLVDLNREDGRDARRDRTQDGGRPH